MSLILYRCHHAHRYELLECFSGCSYFYVHVGVKGPRNDDMAKREGGGEGGGKLEAVA